MLRIPIIACFVFTLFSFLSLASISSVANISVNAVLSEEEKQVEPAATYNKDLLNPNFRRRFTEVHKATLCPEFNEIFGIELADMSHGALRFDVFDYNSSSKNKLIGSATVPMANISHLGGETPAGGMLSVKFVV